MCCASRYFLRPTRKPRAFPMGPFAPGFSLLDYDGDDYDDDDHP